MKKALVLLFAIGLGIGGCAKHPPKTVVNVSKPAVKPIAVATPAGAFMVSYEPAKVKAVVKPYAVKADLSNVANRTLFGKFKPDQKALLARNAFFAAPTTEQQLFFIYEQNEYKNVPSFITTDSVLQVYHIFYDFTLRKTEQEKLYGILGNLTDAMVKESGIVAGRMTNPDWKTAALGNQVYFAVPRSLLGKPTKLPAAQAQTLKAELKLVNTAPGRVQSALFPWKPDYSQFKPRGHYTRSPLFKRYFKAMMWYGYMQFPVLWPMNGNDKTGQTGTPDWPRIRQALLITKMLFDTQINGKPAIETWKRIYEPTAFYVGSSDDIMPYQYKAVMDAVYGPKATYKDLQDEAKLKQVADQLQALPLPRINVRLYDVNTDKKMLYGRLFKFMGQRYIPDSEMMQRLVDYPKRPFPKGLDVMAVLGSERAADILDKVYKEPTYWADYLKNRTELKDEFAKTPLATWQSNLYWGWLWSLDSLLDPFGAGYPSFMTNQAWVDKSLNTSLASWTELRHDTILYAKQSAAECGGDGEVPPMPKGYVEPNVEFYNRLLWLTKASKMGLDKRGLLSAEMGDKFSRFDDLLTFLRDISIKELTNKPVTREEYQQMLLYGANLEMLTLSVIEGGATNWYQITNPSDQDMAVIADVHTSEDSCLEEGVGHASEIYVIVPIEGKLWLTRGAVFSYYEFQQPASNRLTDEQWQKTLKGKSVPPVPAWVKSFLTGVKTEVPVPRVTRSTGC